MTKLHSVERKGVFVERKHRAWETNTNYWLSSSLRHVEDVGEFILETVKKILFDARTERPLIADMGFGNAWILEKLLRTGIEFEYLGIDNHPAFLRHARNKYSGVNHVRFRELDLEEPIPDEFRGCADVVLNAFNFFELSSLKVSMRNAADLCKEDGKMLIATIDKTYLMLAGCASWSEFRKVLKEYQDLPGTKYFFQKIDLGDGESEDLVYPSVLWSLQDFIDEAMGAGMKLNNYREIPFTNKPIPKIYQFLEFERCNENRAEKQ